MFGGEFFEDFFGFRRQLYVDFAVVLSALGAGKVFLFFQSIDEADGAVVGQLEAFGEFANGDVIALGKSFDGEEGLVLLRGQSGGVGGFFAEAEELTEGVTKCGEHFVVVPGDLGLDGHDLV